MFEQFLKRPFHLALYRNGPYAEERSRFLSQLVREGRSRHRLQAINWLLLEVAKHVDLSGGRRSYARGELKALTECWQKMRKSRATSERRVNPEQHAHLVKWWNDKCRSMVKPK